MIKKPMNEYISFKEDEKMVMINSEEFGKHIISKVDRDIGEIVLNVKEPNCFGFSDYYRSRYCYNCFKGASDCDASKRLEISCNQCKQVYFCSVECAERVMSTESFQDNSTTHIHTPLECLIFTTVNLNEELKPQSPHDQSENKMVINYFSKIAYVNVENNSISKENSIKFKNLEIQMSELIGDTVIDGETLLEPVLTDFKNRSIVIKSIFSKYGYDIELNEIIDVFIKSQKNVFGLWNEYDGESSFGIALYCGGAPFFNHSCFPNVCRVQNNQSLLFYSLVPIKQGDQIFNSYYNIKHEKSKRLEHLKISYNFDCKCQRCSAPDENNQFEELIIKNSCRNKKLINCAGKLYLPINNKIRICSYCKWEEKD